MKNITNESSITDNKLSEYINDLTNDIDSLIKSKSDNDIDNIKNKLIDKMKEIMNNFNNQINILKKENSQLQKKYDKYKANGEIKKKFLENQLKNVYKKNIERVNQIKNKTSEISKLKEDLNKLKNKYDNDLNKFNKEQENLNIKNENLEKMNKKLECDISELKELNSKYEETINELEKENNEINDLLIENQAEIKSNKKKLDQMQNEIVELNTELDEREQDFQEYKNKYEKETKRNEKLEKKIQELLNTREQENEYMTEYEIKERKIPKRLNTERNRNTSEIRNVERRFRYLYRTVENLNSRNQSKNSHNSTTISNKEKNNTFENTNNNSINSNNKKKEEKPGLFRTNASKGFKQLLNKYKSCSKNEEINSNDIFDENSTNFNSNSSIKLTPENYTFIKLYQLNNKLKWCLFKKNKNKTLSHIRRYSMNNDILNSDMDMCTYSDFIWVPYKTNKDFPEFREISSFVDSCELKRDETEDLKMSIKNLENIILEKNKENNKLSNALSNLVIENKKYKNYNEKLKEENYKMKSGGGMGDKNFIGVSFIADDPESSKFFDDKCCEDILTGLEKNPNRNNQKKISCYSDKLKNCIDLLMTKVIPNEDINNLMGNILWQLGCSSDDINKLIGIHRGVINTNPSNKKK